MQDHSTKSLTAIGYVRVSTEEQATEGVSLEAQRAKVVAYSSSPVMISRQCDATTITASYAPSSAACARLPPLLGFFLLNSFFSPGYPATQKQAEFVFSLNGAPARNNIEATAIDCVATTRWKAPGMQPRYKSRSLALVLSLAVAQTVSPVMAATDGLWNVDGGGSWTTPSNWLNNGIPTTAGDTATFGQILTDPSGATITLDGDQTVAALTFNSTAGAYTLAQGSGGTLFLNGNTTGTSNLSINVNAGQTTLSVPVSANAISGSTWPVAPR